MKHLEAFLKWVEAERARGQDIHLVVAGDFVDFLAEPDDDTKPRDQWEWTAFCGDESLALAKLERILARTAPVWEALATFVSGAGALTLLLGNHDVELSLPRVRGRLLKRIAPRGGRVTFLYDGEAFGMGKLLIEHGNRYEGWNVVAHEALREFRARLSRRERPGDFPAQPGSALVARVMNGIKVKYGFVDLLKPETGGVVPILAVLDPGLWRRTGPGISSAARAAWRQNQFGADGKPTRGEFVRASAPLPPAPRGSEFVSVPPVAAEVPHPADLPFPDEEALRLADEATAGARDERISPQDLEFGLLLRAFRMRRDKDQSTFAVDQESELYLRPARAMAADGFKVVVFGHTHLAKRVDLGSGCTYLNTGTWADLMSLPESIYTGTEEEGVVALRSFVDSVKHNRIDEFRRHLPTYARIDVMDDGEILSCGTYFFDGDGPAEEVTTAEIMKRLAGARL